MGKAWRYSYNKYKAFFLENRGIMGGVDYSKKCPRGLYNNSKKMDANIGIIDQGVF